MKKNLFILLLFMSTAVSIRAAVSIVPMPDKCVEKRGHFTINKKTIISLSDDNEEMRNAVSFFNDLFRTATGDSLEVTGRLRSRNVIRCRLTPSLASDEAYRLDVSPSSIRIEAKNAKGVFYALQSVRQLLPAAIESDRKVANDVKWTVPCVLVDDAPQFSYRGVMLDVSRHFIPKEDMKRHIDLLAFHKLNTLHWHLTDDQGWRIEIKKYPKLTQKGAYRPKTIKGYMWNNPTEWDTNRYGGFYTQEDIKEIVAYASKRFIEIIPEIEMPGHSVAPLTAYPQYSCSGGPFEVEGRWGVFNDIYCTKEITFDFLQDILDEVVELFPSRFIHLGGDEAPRVRWKNCVHCQQRMKEEGLKNEAELQTYFMNRIENYLSSKGKNIIGWDEILEGGIPQRAVVMSWRGEKGGIQAANAGYDVIMSPNIYMYFNCYQSKTQKKIGMNKRIISLEKAYNYHPVPEVLPKEKAKHIKGVQANLWTEYLVSRKDMEYMLYPRVAALSEVGWTPKQQKDYSDFCNRLEYLRKHYDMLGVNYYQE